MRVSYNKGCFYTKFEKSNYRLGGWDMNSIKVIGNIYENRDLLN